MVSLVSLLAGPQTVTFQYALTPLLKLQRVASAWDENDNRQRARPRARRQSDFRSADQFAGDGGQDVRERALQYGVVVFHHVAGEDQTDFDGPVSMAGRLQGVFRRH